MRFVVNGVEYRLIFFHHPVRHGWMTECGITVDREPAAWTRERCHWLDMHVDGAPPSEVRDIIDAVEGAENDAARLAAAAVASIAMRMVRRQRREKARFTRENRRIGREITVGRAFKAMYPGDKLIRRALLAAYHAALYNPAHAENAYRGIQQGPLRSAAEVRRDLAARAQVAP